ncbi:MAG: hypothetical protein ABSF25_10190 [Bryobacteraceae bacterium]
MLLYLGMCCPYFDPTQPRGAGGSAMLPLGGEWAGLCRAEPAAPVQPDDAGLCNLGYARGACPRFPNGEGPDAVRFTVQAVEETGLRLYYVVERDHHPFAHGPLEFSLASGALMNPPHGQWLGRQALAYVRSYLRRKAAAA